MTGERQRQTRSPQRRPAPRLVLRFAVFSALALGVAAAAILVVVRHLASSQAESSSARQARVIAEAVLKPTLGQSDVEDPIASGPRRSELDGFFTRHLLVDGTQLVTIYRSDGLVTYATDHTLIGEMLPSRSIEEAAGGSIISRSFTPSGGRKVLRTYVPLVLRRGESPAVVAIDQDYAPIAQAAGETFFPVALVLELALVALFVLFLPLLRRTSLRIQRQMEEIEYAAYHDELTGLPNRRHFQEGIADAIAAAVPGRPGPAVLLLDLNHFKDVNDTLGHQAGDALLEAVAIRLSESLDEFSMLARLGGDEFVVLLPSASESQAISEAKRLVAALKDPVVIDRVPLAVETGVGVAVYPQHGEDPGTLLRRADVAMYTAKEEYRSHAVYDPEADTNDRHRLALVHELQRAIADRELEVVFQPKLRIADRRIVGAEALLRWEHPEHGPISPADFVPLAERTSLIRPLTRYVLETAARQIVAWHRDGIDLQVAVNLSAADLLDESLPGEIAMLARDAGLDLSSLELEITESAVMSNPTRARHVLSRLDGLGIRLAIDDFGTGYSSLAYLKSLPVKTLKIDRSFVLGMTASRDDATIVRSTVELGHNLGLEVVAEGVESEEALAALRGLRCDYAQGYLIGKGATPEELARSLAPPEARFAA